MKKLILLLFPLFALAQNPTSFPYGIKNTAATSNSTPTYFVTQETDGVHKKTPAAVVAKTDDVILKNETPQVKTGGLTIGVNLANSNDKWVAFGTSVTYGGAYTNPTAAQLNITLLNYGVAGSTSNNLASQYTNIPTWTTEYRLLSIEHSINDAAQSVPLATFRANIENCIANAKGKGWPNDRILVINGNYCSRSDLILSQPAYANEALLIAKEQGVQYFDAYNYTKDNGGDSLLSDEVHPTTAGGLVYTRGLIASMQGGMEITNALTVVNGVTINGNLIVSKNITNSGNISTLGNIAIDYNKYIGYSGAWNSKLYLSDISGNFEFTNGFETAGYDFFTSNGVRDNKEIAFRIYNNKNMRGYGDLTIDGELAIGFDKGIAYAGAWTNSFKISEASGSTGIFNGYASGDINFYTSNGVTNASNLAFRINNNRSLSIPSTPTTSVGSYDILTRNSSTGVVEKILSNTIATVASPSFTGTPTAPTATAGTNTTQIATTAFVQTSTASVASDVYGSDVSLSSGQSPYTLQLSDANARLTTNGTFNQNYSIVIPTNASVPFQIGTKIRINISSAQAGYATLSGSGITFLGANLQLRFGGSFNLTKVATDTWFVEHTNILQINGSGNRIISISDSVFSGDFEGGFNGNLNQSKFPVYTVATLPTTSPNAAVGNWAYVTDALAPAYLTPVVGGGAIVTPVFYNGTNWVCH